MASRGVGTVLSRLHLKHMNVHNSYLAPWSGSGVRLTSIMLALHALLIGGHASARTLIGAVVSAVPLIAR